MTTPKAFVDYLRVEQVGGGVLLVAAVLALVAANSPLAEAYDALRRLAFGPELLGARLDVAHWAADGLLAVFFFVVGLEVKRELVVGELSDRQAALLPVCAALGGMVVPALVYLAVAGPDRGWAVPTATDIAFALGVLAVAGSRAPASLRLFLLALAVVDDLGAIALIAVVYTASVAVLPLLGGVALCGAYAVLQRVRVTTWLVYVPLSAGVWLCVHASGVHATVAGVALGLLTRVRADRGEEHSPAERLEHRLQPLSAGVVVPVFAFTAAGVPLSADALAAAVTDRAALGVAAGLLVGKTLGVLAGAFLAVRTGLARLPERVAWPDVAGVAVLAGTGFTVSLLLAELAFTGERAERVTLSVLVASALAALLGAVVVRSRRAAHTSEGPVC